MALYTTSNRISCSSKWGPFGQEVCSGCFDEKIKYFFSRYWVLLSEKLGRFMQMMGCFKQVVGSIEQIVSTFKHTVDIFEQKVSLFDIVLREQSLLTSKLAS